MKRVLAGCGIGCGVILVGMIAFIALSVMLQPKPETVVYSLARHGGLVERLK